MPIIIKDYKWRQTVKTITIQIPLNGVHQSKVDLFTSPKYVKASYSPYFFEVFLLHPIDSAESKCTITAQEIVFELAKEEKREWENLEVDLGKAERAKLKALLIEEEHRRFQKECVEKLARKDALKKVAVREQISLETKQRRCIEDIKKNEKETALGDVSTWRKTVEYEPKIVELLSSSDEDEEEEIETRKVHQTAKKPVRIPRYNLKKGEVTNPIPLPRTTTTVDVEFTDREFPTPSRESRLDEENEWLKKQAEVRRSAGFVSEDLRPEEKNPQYLKAKGDEFLKAGNYLAALSAYTFGIKLSEKYPDLYVNRSEAHFCVGNMQQTIHDCSTALELMKPEVPANFLDRVACILRRGRALFKFGMRRQGFAEVEAAYRLQPYNEDTKQLLVELMNEMNNATEDDDQ